MQDPLTIDSSASRFDLLAQPFRILGTDPAASDAQVQAAYVAALEQRPACGEALADARAAILAPARRLSCELGYPIDSTPAQIEILNEALAADASTQQLLLMAEQLAPLSRANFLAHLTARGPAEATLLLALLDAHVAVDVTGIYATLKQLRNQAGCPTPSLVHVNEGLHELFARHARAAILGYAAPEHCIDPVEECTRSILATGKPYRVEALAVLLDAYRLATAELQSNLDHQLGEACAALQQRPDTVATIAAFTEALGGWILLYRPLILLDEHRGPMDPVVGSAVDRVRRLLAGLSFDQNYPTARKIADLARAAFRSTPPAIELFSQAVAAVQNLAIETSTTPRGELIDSSADPALLASLGESASQIEPNDHVTVRTESPALQRSGRWLALLCAALAGGAVSLLAYRYFETVSRRSSIPMADHAAGPSLPALGPELIPPVGKEQHLTLDYVRYCRFQEERLRIIKGRVQGPDDIKAFNVLANDYNSRCANFYYLDDDLKMVLDELQAKQKTLEADALRIMATWPWRSDAGSASGPAAK